MNKKTLLYSCLLLTLVGCAAKNIVETNGDKGDLVEVFNLDDKKFDKFITKKKSTNEEVSSPIEVKEKKDLKKPAHTIKNKKVAKTSKKAKKSKSAKKEKVVKGTTQSHTESKVVLAPKKNPQEAKDYPKSFIKYNKYKKFWDQYQPITRPGEKISLQVSWTLFNAGVATIETVGDLEIGGQDVIGYRATIESAEYFENIYKLKDVLDTYISKETHLPVKYVLKQRESGQSVDDLQLFDHEELKTYFWYNRLKKGKTKKQEKSAYTPKYFMDSFSAIQFLRGLPLSVGKKIEFPVITRTKVWLFSAVVEKTDEIDFLGKQVKAYKIKAETKYPGVLKKSGDIIFWLTADERRVPLKLEAKIKIGSVKASIIDYKKGNDKL